MPHPSAHASRPTSAALDGAIRAVGALGQVFRNDNTDRENAALDAFREGRPAFWSTATYHNQAACSFVYRANALGIESALDVANDDVFAASRDFLLGCLIPINPAGRRELEDIREAEWKARKVAAQAASDRPAPAFRHAAE